MLILSRKEPVRVTLVAQTETEDEAFIVLAPITDAIRRAANMAARARLGIEKVEDLEGLSLIELGEIVTREIVRLGAIEWGGIGDGPDSPLPLTPDAATRKRTALDLDRPTGSIDLLLADEDLLAVIDDKYVLPDAIRQAEKNGFAASPNGIGEAATAVSATASSSAAMTPPKRPRRAAKAASTGKPPSRPTRPKGSGRS